MRRWIILVAAALLAGPALGQDVKGGTGPAAASAAILARLPSLTSFDRQPDVTDFEARPDGAGLGAAVDYRTPGGPLVTVYLYDRRRRGLRDAASGEAVESELVIAGQEIEGAGRARRYRVADRRRAPDEAGPEGGPGMRCDRYLLAFEGGGEVVSFACAAVVSGRFVKIRASHPRRERALPDDAMPQGFVAALIREVRHAVDGAPGPGK